MKVLERGIGDDEKETWFELQCEAVFFPETPLNKLSYGVCVRQRYGTGPVIQTVYGCGDAVKILDGWSWIIAVDCVQGLQEQMALAVKWIEENCVKNSVGQLHLIKQTEVIGRKL